MPAFRISICVKSVLLNEVLSNYGPKWFKVRYCTNVVFTVASEFLIKLIKATLVEPRKEKCNYTYSNITENTPWNHNVRWIFVWRSDGVLDIFWTSYVLSVHVLCPGALFYRPFVCFYFCCCCYLKQKWGHKLNFLLLLHNILTFGWTFFSLFLDDNFCLLSA